MRFTLNLYRLNNRDGYLKMTGQGNPFLVLPKQEKLVEILKWSFLSNHYHLLLYESVEGGILEFTKRLGNAYTKYFNIKNGSSGYVFQNSAKIILVNKNNQFLYVPFYIDLNPIDLIPEWTLGKISSAAALNFLKSYRWSSYKDYFGSKSSFSPIVNKELFYEIWDISPAEYEKEVSGWLESKSFEALEQHVNLPG